MEAIRLRPRRGGRTAAGMLLALVPALCGASHRSANFAVEAPSADVARKVAERAEECRKAIARAWLGRELATWDHPCSVRVKLTGGEPGGLTTITHARGKVKDLVMTVEGRLDRILASALPHEVTHTVIAGDFGGEVPRWADEGVSILSEDRIERDRHDRIADGVLGRGAAMPLDRLFRVESYPAAIMDFYGQGYSVARFLVEIGGRPRLLRFLRDGSRNGWDAAAREHYGLADVEELDRAWRAWHRVASRTRPEGDPVAVR
jgi:hypothetical protein